MMHVLDAARHRIVTVTSVLLALNVAHVLDHARQGRALDSELYSVGVVSFVAMLVVLGLALKRNSLAGPAALVLGVGTVVGVAAIHVAPTWWALSDSYGDAHADALSWVIIFAMMVAGAALAFTAMATLSKGARAADGG
jgi:uncharacterized membrane protein